MPRQDLELELFYSGVWNDVAAAPRRVFANSVTVTRGQPDESVAYRPAQIVARLDNADDRFRMSNPTSPLYGRAGRKTPVRCSVAATVRGIAEASSWITGQTDDFRASPARGMAWCDLKAGGLLERVNGWKQPLRSALYRIVALDALVPAEWWPMEDVSGSAVAVSAAGGRSMQPVTVVRYTLPDGSPIPPGGAPRFGQGDGVPGAANMVSFQGGGTLSAPVRSRTFNGYAWDWVMRFEPGSDGASSADVLSWREAGTYVNFTVNVSAGNVTVFHANPADDAILAATGSAVATSVDPYDGAPHHYRYRVEQLAGNYLCRLYIDGTFAAQAVNFVPPMAGTVGRPTDVQWNPGEDSGDHMPAAAGQLTLWPSGGVSDQPDTWIALNGHHGELAADRFGRFCAEEDISCTISASSALSMPMGAQRPDTLANLFTEIVKTEDALLFDAATTRQLTFLCRFDRYRQTPVLDLAVTDLRAPPDEVTDNRPIFNVVTASQRDGGDFTARDDTSSVGTQPAPDGVGEEKTTVNVNLADPDTMLPQVAHWWLARYTVDLPRYPLVVIDLNARPDLVADVEAVDVGQVITISGWREYTVRLIVLGIKDVIGTHTRTVAFNCVPDEVFANVAVWDTSRYDTASATLNEDLTTTETNADIIADVLGDAFSITANPYPLVISGELNSCTSGGLRSGAGPVTQTIVLARSQNSVVKTQATGRAIHIDGKARWAL